MVEKAQIKSYLKGKWGVKVESIISELGLTKEDYTRLDEYLRELETEGWIRKCLCCDGFYEFEPGFDQEH